MASGDIHNRYLRLGWFVVFPLGAVIFVFGFIYDFDNFYLFPAFLYLNFLFCEIIDPDADQLGLTSSEGRVLRITRKFYIGLLGALFVSYTFIYAYIIGLFGGHRSFLSHGFLIGTLGRMVFYNAPLVSFFWGIYSYGLVNWGWNPSISVYESFAMNKWIPYYITSQFIAWLIGDTIHLILDSEWAKNKLYNYKSIKNKGY